MSHRRSLPRSWAVHIGIALCIGAALQAPLGGVDPARAAAACAIYVSPGGNSSSSGSSQSNPTSLDAAVGKTSPGSVVCIQGGTYQRSKPLTLGRSGTASAWITYQAYNGTPKLVGSYEGNVVYVPPGAKYIQVNGLNVDGRNISTAGIKCGGATHVRFIGNTVVNSGAGGITNNGCDYIQVEGNLVYHTGYGKGWSSGITNNTPIFADNAPGFHSVIAYNTVSGTHDASAYKSDGNGIILDRGGNTPPTLVIGNVVYQNGGRCIQAKEQTDAWFVNNTCYAHSLDTTRDRYAGSIVAQDSTVHVINNIAYAWTNRPTYDQVGSNKLSTTGIWYSRNLGFSGSGPRGVPSSIVSDPNQIRNGDPLFVNPPSMDSGAGGQYATAMAPWLVTDHFQPRLGSPAINAGIDPRTAPGVTSALLAGMTPYLQTDLLGNERFQGAIDLGAYETKSTAPGVSLTSTPEPSTTSTSAAFAWTTTGTVDNAGCQLDGGTPTDCSSPKSYSGLSIGPHTFSVTVSNASGGNSANYAWNVTAPVGSPDGSTITIYASGTSAFGVYPTMELAVSGERVATFQNVSSYQAFSYTASSQVSPTQVQVSFVNNAKDPATGDNRNLRVDKVKIDGVTYETESAEVYSVGAWTSSTGCAAGYKRVEVLACNGYFRYS